MKFIPGYLLLMLGVFSPSGLGAATSADRAIENAARESYNFRVLLETRVQISVEDGIAKLSGNAHDRNLRALATDTVAGIPGVRGVLSRVIVDASITEYSDTWIAQKLRFRLLARANIDPTRIQVEVSRQGATLTGSVENLEQKQLVEKYAETASWVRSVNNQLTIDKAPTTTVPLSPPVDDASISALLIYSLKDQRPVTLSRTEISTRQGVIFIAGHAESEAEKILISNCALSIRGVTAVRNDMLVRSEDGVQAPYAAR